MNFNELINRIRMKLPLQNPLYSYVHNNILQMFETKDFHEAVSEAGRLYRARPYWPEVKYRERYIEGKITEKDIREVIKRYQEQFQSISSLDKLEISSTEFFYHLMLADFSYLDEEALVDISDQKLWEQCQRRVENENSLLLRSVRKWRGKEYWEDLYNEYLAESLHPFVIRLISSYLDQGQSYWNNPFKQKGFWNYFIYDVKSLKSFSSDWQKILVKKVEQYEHQPSSEVIQKELQIMGIPEEEWENYLLDILFDLKGWAGMVNKLEQEPWQALIQSPDIQLEDYLASLVLLESSLDSYYSEYYSVDLSMLYGRVDKVELDTVKIALALYQITKSFRLKDVWMNRFDNHELLNLVCEVDDALHVHRIRLWHEAYEYHFHHTAILAIAEHSQAIQERKTVADVQVLFCIDDREESLRRHLEEIDYKIKTYGVVGFFGIDMNFSSLKNGRFIAQCPPVIRPSRVVKERSQNDLKGKFFNKMNNRFGGGDLTLYYNSRTLFRGFLTSLILGLASIFPMFLQVFFPHESKKLSERISEFLNPEPESDLDLDANAEGHGYSKKEMAGIVATVLKMCGINEFSPIIVLLSHGSSSTNNPFKQSYGCGACGGNAGIPNSKAFAKMANDPQVRIELSGQGLLIPKETFFVSGHHDTCTDEVKFFNEGLIPNEHLEKFERFKKNIKIATERNALERCQRFSSFTELTADKAIKHVRERAIDIAQPRPEYGHSSNALAIVGRRDLTHGLFLNRRSFLLSYDWTTDPTGEILAQVVLGGVPVAVNINMDYYFSCVDNENFGCGSKLPLNMTSLLGVMTGSQGDLRIGLARQMVEIHEPIRNLTLIEAPLDKVKKLFDTHPRLKNILYNHWMKLVVIDPQTGVWSLFGTTEFGSLNLDKFSFKQYKSSLDLLSGLSKEMDDFAEIRK